jgi:hypothetical protein
MEKELDTTKTPIEKLIQAVENGAFNNQVLWDEWKRTMLEYEILFEKERLYKAYLIGRTDANISEKEGKYIDTFEQWF